MPTPPTAASPSSSSAPWSASLVDVDALKAEDDFFDDVAPWFMHRRPRSRALWRMAVAVAIAGVIAGCVGHTVVMGVALTALLAPAVMLASARVVASTAGVFALFEAVAVAAVFWVRDDSLLGLALAVGAVGALGAAALLLPVAITSVLRLAIREHTPADERTSVWPILLVTPCLLVIGPPVIWLVVNSGS